MIDDIGAPSRHAARAAVNEWLDRPFDPDDAAEWDQDRLEERWEQEAAEHAPSFMNED